MSLQDITADKPDVTADKSDVTSDKPDVTVDKQAVTADKGAVTADKGANIVRNISTIGILLLAIYVALVPNIVYAPTSRVVLFLLVSILPAVLLSAESKTRFKLQLPGVIITAFGAIAIVFGLLFVLDYLSKPQVQIALYQIVDEDDNALMLDFDGAVNVPPTPNGLLVNKFVQGNMVVLIFPEQVGQTEIQVKKSPTESVYKGQVDYAGSRRLTLQLGKDLKTRQK